MIQIQGKPTQELESEFDNLFIYIEKVLLKKGLMSIFSNPKISITKMNFTNSIFIECKNAMEIYEKIQHLVKKIGKASQKNIIVYNNLDEETGKHNRVFKIK